MGWLFGKKKVEAKGEKSREVQVLVQQEERFQQKAAQLAAKALREFTHTAGQLYYGTDHANEQGWVAFSHYTDEKARDLGKEFNGVAATLLDIRVYLKKIVKLAQVLEADLLEVREGDKNKKAAYLSEDEHRVLSFGQDLDSFILLLVQKVKEFSKFDFARIKNTGYMNPKDEAAGKEAKKLLDDINLSIAGLEKNLAELYALEKKVEELTNAYLAV